MTDPLALVYNKRDDTGAAAILQKSNESAADLFVKQQQARGKEAQEKLEPYKWDYTGADAKTMGAWLNDRPELAKELTEIKTADAMARFKRKQLGEQKFAEVMGIIEMKKQQWNQKSAKSVGDAQLLNKYVQDINSNPSNYPESVKQQVFEWANQGLDRSIDPSVIQKFDNIDLTGFYTPKSSVWTEDVTVPLPNGGTFTRKDTYLDPVELEKEAEAKAEGKNYSQRDWEKARKGYLETTDNPTKEGFVNYIKEQTLKSGQFKGLRSRKTTAPPVSIRKGIWDNDSYRTDKFIFNFGTDQPVYTEEQDKTWDEYKNAKEKAGQSVTDDERETYQTAHGRPFVSFVRTDAGKNTEQDLQDSKMEAIKARPLGLIKDKGKWNLFVQLTEKRGRYNAEQRIIIPFEGSNRQKIEGEYYGVSDYINEINKRYFSFLRDKRK